MSGRDAVLHALDETLDCLDALLRRGRALLKYRVGDTLDARYG